MPAALKDFSWVKFDDGSLAVSMTPPQPVGGWDIQFRVTKRFGGESGLIVKSCASGFAGVSGITIAASGEGDFTIRLNSLDTSGLSYGNYAYQTMRRNSGAFQVINEGYLLLTP